MSTWEQRMAQRTRMRGTNAYRAEEEYQRARCYALARARDYVRGPDPFSDELPECCWENVWIGYRWGVRLTCNHPALHRQSSGVLCDHAHHKGEVWMANAA
jgi:hypothetical protein